MAGRRAPRRATIDQVAQLADVSIKTVSRVTNNEPNVRPEVRQRVTEAIGKLGYQPMQSARHLAARRSRMLALVYDNPSPSYLMRVQVAARQCCQDYGFRLLFHPCDQRDPRLATELVRLAAGLRLEGLVLTPPVSLNDAVVRALAAAQVPVSLLAPARAVRGSCAILLDDQHAAQVLGAHVIGLGHRRIGFVRGHPDHEASRARLAGFRRAMAEAGLAVEEPLVVDGDFSFESGRSAGAGLLDRQQRPTAVIASNDDMAAGVIAAAHERGIAVPGDLSVCGFDDTPLAGMLWPPLTTMHQPISELAHAGTRMLLERIRSGRAPAPPDALRCELVVRASTAPPRRERGAR
jgi:LacI family transcriptional regulator